MLGLTNKAIITRVTVLALFIVCVDCLWCRNGIEDRYSTHEWTSKCDYGETACFQSVKCLKIGGTSYKDYEWRCIDGSKCSNATGTPTAYYLDVKGTCCFTDNCNANHGPCTDAGIGLTATWISIVFATVLAFFLV